MDDRGDAVITARKWLPWIGSLALFAVALPSVSEVLESRTELDVPILAALAAVPFGLITTRPALGWLLSAGGALLVSRAFPVVDGDPWPWPTVHGLVLLALLFAVALRPPPHLTRSLRVATAVAAALATAVLFAVSVPDDLRAGWTVGVTVVALAGTLVRSAGLIHPAGDAAPPVSLTEVRARLLGGFREAFVDWVTSPPAGPPLGHRLLPSSPWVERVRAVVPWLLALGVFWIAVAASIRETLVVHDLVLPILAALIALPVGLSRRYALLGWRLATVLAAVVAVIGTQSGGLDPGAWPVIFQWVWLASTFLVSVRHDRWTTGWVWAVTVMVIATGAPVDSGVAITMLVVATAFTIIGDLVRSRRRARHELERQTELSELEKARRTVLEERARIARDLHDVVAHHMSMVVVQAESAPYRISGLPPQAQEEFAAISTSARQALTEIRGLLGVLRSEDREVTHAPQPGLDQVGELVESAARSGVPVRLSIDGSPTAVGTQVGLSAYRIVQESLANAARHAPGAEVDVTIVYASTGLELTIVNAAPATPVEPAGPGHGLIGMGERANVVGGTLTTDARPGGGFEVRATLPFHVEEPS
ncbi:signal transduction histidine kinase [Haloactinopolyspora alba]|uniref:histidine kinase n=1 Tax=Haloactinopolyspora alba TaxID=648780 RepID=A0A2P8E2N3_9ACTN|nr:sensor histidine kinase [Haloactinopolyspora alba]PSL03735.1 signal transduction histidine kinase [Haloactinopolyspora alba]